MARIDIRDEIDYPRDLVFETFREHLVELQPYLPTVDNIDQTEYERVDDDTVEIVNVWEGADKDIPRLAQKFIKPEMLRWTDYATWHDDDYTCDWNMEVGFLQEAIECSGTTTYREKRDKTEIHIQGDLEVDAAKIPGVPRLVASKVGDAVESFVVKMITPNLKEVNRGAEKYLASKDD